MSKVYWFELKRTNTGVRAQDKNLKTKVFRYNTGIRPVHSAIMNYLSKYDERFDVTKKEYKDFQKDLNFSVTSFKNDKVELNLVYRTSSNIQVMHVIVKD